MPKNRKSSKQWAKFPMTLDDNYKRRLKPVSTRIRKLYKSLVEPELKELTKFEYIDTASFDDSIEEKIGKIFHGFRVNYYGVNYPIDGDPKTLAWRKLLETQVRAESKSVARVHKRRFNGNVNFILGVDPLKNEPWLSGKLADWTAENVGLIKGIPEFAISSMQNTIMESVSRGDSMTFLKKQIGKILNDSDRRLKLIARDQTNKLYGALTSLRSQSNGWDFYQWADSNDSRVRKDHVVLDNLSDRGMFFRFSDPPVADIKTGQRGNPGDPIMCRCVSLVSFEPADRFKRNNDIRNSYSLKPDITIDPKQLRAS